MLGIILMRQTEGGREGKGERIKDQVGQAGWMRGGLWRSAAVTPRPLKREIKGKKKEALGESHPFCRYTGMSSIAFRGNRRSSLRTCCFQETSLFLWVSEKAWHVERETAGGKKGIRFSKSVYQGSADASRISELFFFTLKRKRRLFILGLKKQPDDWGYIDFTYSWQFSLLNIYVIIFFCWVKLTSGVCNYVQMYAYKTLFSIN